MASIDLSGDSARQIRDTYKSALGRDASDDEVSKWLSGTYGYGDANNLAPVLSAITNSHEARNRIPASPPPAQPPTLGQVPDTSHGYEAPQQSQYQNLDYWSGQGVPYTDIFNLNTGQLQSGWARTGKGYERTAPQASAAPQGGDVEAWVRSQLGGASSPQALAALESQLSQRGVRLQKDSAGNVRGRLYLPDGRTVDVVTDWGQPWAWIDRGKGAGGVGGGPAPGNQYSDPYTQFLESLIKSRIGSLQGGYDDTARRAYETALQSRAQSLATGNKQLDQLMAYLQERFTDLKQPAYTGAENEVLRTGALDPIEQDRSAARKRILERLSARGLDPNSGIAQQALLEVDNAFEALRGTTQTQLATNELARRENRSQRAEGIAAQMADIPELRAREQLDVFQALNNLSTVARNEDEARSREAIQYGGVLSDLGPQRLNLAMQAAGMGGNTSGLSSLLSQIAGLNQNAAGMNQQNSNALWSGLGSLAAILARQQGALGGAGI